MLTGLNTIYSNGSYEQERDLMIKVSEDQGLYNGTDLSALRPKVGGADGHLVLGYGYDLLENDISEFQQDLLAAGVVLTTAQNNTLTATISDYKAGAITATVAANLLSFIDLQNETTASALLTEKVNRFEFDVDKRLLQFNTTTMRQSRERAVLVSLAYNGGTWNSKTGKGLLGPKLMDAIRDDNRADAWYEIRYGSNGNAIDGIAKRRYYESTLFGLYDEGTTASNITDTQAREVYEMYTDNRVAILDYENIRSSNIANANRDYSTSTVQTLENNLTFAADYLIQNNVTDQSLWGSINPLDIQVADNNGEGLTGTERDGYLITNGNAANQRNDLLIGGTGNDILSGLGGEDILVGGNDDDQYVVNKFIYGDMFSYFVSGSYLLPQEMIA